MKVKFPAAEKCMYMGPVWCAKYPIKRAGVIASKIIWMEYYISAIQYHVHRRSYVCTPHDMHIPRFFRISSAFLLLIEA